MIKKMIIPKDALTELIEACLNLEISEKTEKEISEIITHLKAENNLSHSIEVLNIITSKAAANIIISQKIILFITGEYSIDEMEKLTIK